MRAGNAACMLRQLAHSTPSTKHMRLLILDDSPAFLEAAQAALESGGMRVVGVASTSDEALHRIDELRPDVVLVDIDLGAESGFDAARRLVEASDPPPRVILISSHAGDDFEDLIATSPAVGFVAKSALSVDAIRAVLEGAGEAA
jgi:two-component system, NarL family, nitrate/nitrite response regulator NarL